MKRISEIGLPTCNLEKGENKYLQGHLAWLLDDLEIKDPHGKGERAAVCFIRSLRHPKSRF
jgi:hypothetical protein